MIYAILSDVHANLEALAVVINYVIDLGIKEILSCGDLVGYGPDPSSCINFLRRYNFSSVIGNHDKAILSDSLSIYFNEEAVVALNIQKSSMKAEEIEYLRTLPMQINKENFTITHSFLDKKKPFKYVLDAETAFDNLSFTKRNIIFLGHTHIPCVYVFNGSNVEYLDGSMGLTLEMNPRNKYVINVGSVGQSRDNNADLSFGIFDSSLNYLRLIRLPYPIAKTQVKMKKLGFPEYLFKRLSQGC